MTKYAIKIKRDWGRYGFWNPETRRCEKKGFVVSGPSSCGTFTVGNCMPGAIWFKTIEDAMRGIKVHMKTGDTMEFYDQYKLEKAATG